MESQLTPKQLRRVWKIPQLSSTDNIHQTGCHACHQWSSPNDSVNIGGLSFCNLSCYMVFKSEQVEIPLGTRIGTVKRILKTHKKGDDLYYLHILKSWEAEAKNLKKQKRREKAKEKGAKTKKVQFKPETTTIPSPPTLKSVKELSSQFESQDPGVVDVSDSESCSETESYVSSNLSYDLPLDQEEIEFLDDELDDDT